MARKKRLLNKKAAKNYHGRCQFCGEDRQELLDAHRIVPGEEGGVYSDPNTVVACANCHRLTHAGVIRIDRKYFSTQGWLLHYWDESGSERWEPVASVMQNPLK